MFKTPEDNRTDFIKRLIGLPGDKIQFFQGNIILNDKIIDRKKTQIYNKISCGKYSFETNAFIENLPNGKKYTAVYNKVGTLQNTSKFKIPKDHFFFLGDNRDCSRDSRFDTIGFVHKDNLVGKAQLIFFSNDTIKSRVLKFWNLNDSLRYDRFFKKIK